MPGRCGSLFSHYQISGFIQVLRGKDFMPSRSSDKVHGLGQLSSYNTIPFRYYFLVVIVSFVVSGNMTGLRSKSEWSTYVELRGGNQQIASVDARTPRNLVTVSRWIYPVVQQQPVYQSQLSMLTRKQHDSHISSTLVSPEYP